jgi:hypothetical protein
MERNSAFARRAAGLALVLLSIGPAAGADGDYSDMSFSVRMPAVFIRFTEVEAMGGQTAANRHSSAINPAAAAWTEAPSPLNLHTIPSAFFSHIDFDEGTRLHVTGEALTIGLGEWGVFQPAMAQIRSNRASMRSGAIFDYRVDTLRGVWAKRWGDLALGSEFSFSEAETKFDAFGMRVSESKAENYRLRLGGLYQPAEKWLVGLVSEYGFAPYRAENFTFIPPFGPIVKTKFNDTPQQFVLRPSASYEYMPDCTTYLDYQYGAFFDKLDTLHSHRLNGGVQHRLYQWLYGRLGGGLDLRGNVSGTIGASVHFAEWGSFEVGYLYNMFPELRPEFGRSHTLQAVLSLRF